MWDLAARLRTFFGLSNNIVTRQGDAAAAERRHTTVLFADMVGSTEMTARTDPEAMSEILRAYRDAVSKEIVAQGGYIAKFMGDGVIAYFGWPRAQEDAAERAVRAGLAIVPSVSQIKDEHGQELHTRVGIATGLVVIGEVVGKGVAREQTVVGDAPNLASRLQAMADPNCVLIADATHRLLGRMFECEDCGPSPLKGFEAHQSIWRVSREFEVPSRFAGARALRTRFVGRERELELIGAAWARARGGNGNATLVAGEPGIGKSRLVDAFRTSINGDAHSVMLWQCLQYHSNNALYPVVRCLEATAGLRSGDAPAANAERLNAELVRTLPSRPEARQLIRAFLGLPIESGAPLALPAQRKAALISALNEWVVGVSLQRPLLLIVEDVHWIDPTTRDLISRLVGRVASARIQMVLTARLDDLSQWQKEPGIIDMALDRLSATECRRAVESVAADRLDRALIEEVVTKGDGNPLFLEELTLAVLDSGDGARSVPDSLQDTLMARLDRLGRARESAQLAAVIGRRFPVRLLAAASSRNQEELDADLSALVAAGLAYATESGHIFEFKHALVRDVAYESLLRTRRRQIHGSLAHLIEKSFREIVDREPDLLAHHFEMSGEHEKAADYLELAGDRAAGRHAYVEAIADYRAALTQATQLQAGTARDGRELALRLKLGPAVVLILGIQHPQVKEAYEPALKLARDLHDVDATFKATWGLWFQANLGRSFTVAQARAEELVAISNESKNDEHILEAMHCRWSTALFRGDYRACLADARQGVARYDQARHHKLGLVFGGHDPGVCAQVVCANCLVFDGRFAQARRSYDEALGLAERLQHPPSLALALQVTLLGYPIMGDVEAVRRYALQLRDLSRNLHLPPQEAVGVFFCHWVGAVVGDGGALDRMEDDFQRLMTVGSMPIYYTAIMGERLAQAGRHEDALSMIDKHLATFEPRVGLCLSEVHRVRGECLLAVGRQGEAQAALRAARDLAQQQGSRLFELRAAIGLVRASDGERRTEALADLHGLTALFHEAADATELVESRTLFAEQG